MAIKLCIFINTCHGLS